MHPVTAPQVLALARSLDARDISELARTYRQWRDVLAAAVDTLHVRGSMVDAGLAHDIADTLAANGPVPASDIEDAAMALWLSTSAANVATPDATTELLREPWRTFNARRTANELQLT